MTEQQTSVERLCRKRSPSWWPYAIVGGVLAIVLGSLVWVLADGYSAHLPPASVVVQAAPPQPEVRVTITESTGGKDHTKGATSGPEMSLSGDKVDGQDLQIKAHDFTLFDVGGITGGAFSGSIKASVSGQMWIRILGLLVFVGGGALAFLNFKKNPLDWHFWGGLACGSLAGLVVAVNPDLFWIGLGGVVLAALLNFLPSITATKTTDAGQWYDDFTESDPDIKAKWIAFRAKMPTSAKSVIDNLIKRTNT